MSACDLIADPRHAASASARPAARRGHRRGRSRATARDDLAAAVAALTVPPSMPCAPCASALHSLPAARRGWNAERDRAGPPIPGVRARSYTYGNAKHDRVRTWSAETMSTITRRLDVLEARTELTRPIVVLFLNEPDEPVAEAWARHRPGRPFDPDAPLVCIRWVSPGDDDGVDDR